MECASYEHFCELQSRDMNATTATNSTTKPSRIKKYCLVVVTEPARQRILLGHKNRGLGEGFYNSFGGKIEANESPLESAQRELREETNIHAPLKAFHNVGTLRFTWQKQTQEKESHESKDLPEMEVHLFRVNVTTNHNNNGMSRSKMTNNLPMLHTLDLNSVIACADDEITPQWFDDWHLIPLHQMFADDSIWIPRLLDSTSPLQLDGWFHFKAGGTDVNSILFYYLQEQSAS